MNPTVMQPYIAPRQVAESPQKTGVLIAGISLLTIGVGVLVLYLVKKSRAKDEEEMKRLINGEPVEVYQPKATTIGGLLDELTAFGKTTPSSEVKNSLAGANSLAERKENAIIEDEKLDLELFSPSESTATSNVAPDPFALQLNIPYGNRALYE